MYVSSIHSKLNVLQNFAIFDVISYFELIQVNCVSVGIRYLLKDQLKGPSSTEGYERALKKGCRYIECKYLV